MKISYNWLKLYIPECPTAEKMYDIFTYHLCEVENIEKREDGDVIFDINILPNRAHDLLSHQGIARELASLLDIKFIDPIPKYKIPESKSTNLKIKVESDKCRRYMGRIVRNVKIGPSPDWVKNNLESIGQRSINNIVDGANITMYDSGQPTHCFDLDKIQGGLIIREAREGEEITTLDNKQVKLKTTDLVIADDKNVLAIAGVKGGKIAEVDENTKNIIIEVANFDPISVRKTGRGVNLFTDALKRFENDLSPTLCDFAMTELSGLFVEYGFNDFEDIVDIYPEKQIEKTLIFRTEKISKMLGIIISQNEIENILKKYNFSYKLNGDNFEIVVPLLRLDLQIEEDMVEEIGRMIGYDKVVETVPKISFISKVNETFENIQKARLYLLSQGYSEVMTYTFVNKGKVEVLATASDKKFLRTNLKDGLKESLALNKLNAPILNENDIKVFEIGTVWNPNEEINICFNDKKEIKEISLKEFVKNLSDSFIQDDSFSYKKELFNENLQIKKGSSFKMWSLFPFIIRDIAVWVPENEGKDKLENLLKENMTKLCVKGPEIFDIFSKENRTSYGFRMIFQSYERTLTDVEVGEIMIKITNEINKNKDWQIR